MTQEGELNPALRFANVTFWWALICGVQWIVAWGITEPYFIEQPELRYALQFSSLQLNTLWATQRWPRGATKNNFDVGGANLEVVLAERTWTGDDFNVLYYCLVLGCVP